ADRLVCGRRLEQVEFAIVRELIHQRLAQVGIVVDEENAAADHRSRTPGFTERELSRERNPGQSQDGDADNNAPPPRTVSSPRRRLRAARTARRTVPIRRERGWR